MSFIGRVLEFVIVVGFLFVLGVRELLRAHGSKPARRYMRRLMPLLICLGVAFTVVIGRRFYGLAT